MTYPPSPQALLSFRSVLWSRTPQSPPSSTRPWTAPCVNALFCGLFPCQESHPGALPLRVFLAFTRLYVPTSIPSLAPSIPGSKSRYHDPKSSEAVIDLAPDLSPASSSGYPGDRHPHFCRISFHRSVKIILIFSNFFLILFLFQVYTVIMMNLNHHQSWFQRFTSSPSPRRPRSSSLVLFLYRSLPTPAQLGTISLTGLLKKLWLATQMLQNGFCSLPSPKRTANPLVGQSISSDEFA